MPYDWSIRLPKLTLRNKISKANAHNVAALNLFISIKRRVRSEDLDVDLFLPNLTCGLFENEADEETES